MSKQKVDAHPHESANDHHPHTLPRIGGAP